VSLNDLQKHGINMSLPMSFEILLTDLRLEITTSDFKVVVRLTNPTRNELLTTIFIDRTLA